MKATVNKDGTVTLTAIQGDTWEIILTLKQPNNQPMDLTGCQVRGQIRKDYMDASAVASFGCQVLTPATDGKVKISVDAITTASILGGKTTKDPKGKYVYDIEIVDTAGSVFKPLRGDLIVLLEVTK